MAPPTTTTTVFFNLPDREWDDETQFLDAHEVGEYFQNFLRTTTTEQGLRLTQEDLDFEAGPSAEALKCFLESTRRNTRVAFRRFLEGTEGFKHCEYASFKAEYDKTHFQGFTRGLYLIDKELLVRRKEILASPDMPGSTTEKIDIILSTIFWIDELDTSSAKVGWKTTFILFDQGRLKQYFTLLWSTPMIRYFNEPEQGVPRELDHIIDNVWEWLDTHNQRPIKLVFSMVRHGMMWDIQGKGQMDRLHSIMESLHPIMENLHGTWDDLR